MKKSVRKKVTMAIALILAMTIVTQTFMGQKVNALVTPMGNWQDVSNTSTVWYGDGSASVYIINNAEDLAGLAKLVNAGNTFSGKTINLGGNIDLGAHYWTPIGDYYHPFSGSFDGQNYVISNLIINQPSLSWAGLFGLTSTTSAISNLGISNVSIMGDWLLGGLAGENMGSITNSYSTGVIYGYAYIGGLVGRNEGSITTSHASSTVTATSSSGGGLVGQNVTPGSISNSYSSGLVNGDSYLGGLAGENFRASITNSYSTSNVEGVASMGYLGGLVGMFSGTIENCYATGSITGLGNLGGLIGEIYLNGTITNAYATGSVTGTDNLGGLIGDIYGNGSITNTYASGKVTVKATGSGINVGGLIGTGGIAVISNSFWDTETTGQTISAGGTGKTTKLMKQQSSFIDWNFAVPGVWSIKSGSEISYPYLQTTTQTPAPGLETISYEATITINKDNALWVSNLPDIRLSTSSSALSGVITVTPVNGVYTFETLAYDTTYYVWEYSETLSAYTGKSVSNSSVSASLDYYTLNYDGNGATGGTMPSQAVLENTAITLSTNAFEKTGFSFAGWNTQADGKGTAYTEAVSYTMTTGSETLYAQWSSNTEPNLPDTGEHDTLIGLFLILGISLLGISELVLKKKSQN